MNRGHTVETKNEDGPHSVTDIQNEVRLNLKTRTLQVQVALIVLWVGAGERQIENDLPEASIASFTGQ